MIVNPRIPLSVHFRVAIESEQAAEAREACLTNGNVLLPVGEWLMVARDMVVAGGVVQFRGLWLSSFGSEGVVGVWYSLA